MEAGLFFLPAHLGNIGKWKSGWIAGRNGMGLSHLRRFKDNMGKFPPLKGHKGKAMLFV